MTAYRNLCPSQQPLAQLLYHTIEQSKLSLQTIVQKMGYQPKNILQACDRLRHVIGSDYLGLDNSYYDFRFSSLEFLQALFNALNIQPEQYQDELNKLQNHLQSKQQAIKNTPSYLLRADIDFDFSNSANNWLTKMGVAKFYQLTLPDDFAYLDKPQQENIIKFCIRQHYQQYKHNLPYHGIIKGYRLIVDDNKQKVVVKYSV